MIFLLSFSKSQFGDKLYIKEHPKHWAYVQAMPRERLERSIILTEIREVDRQQRMRDGVLKRIGRDPDLKQAYDRLVKDLPEEQRADVIAQLERQKERIAARAKTQEPPGAIKV